MKEIKEKSAFVAQVKREIEVSENLIKWYEEKFLPTLKKFDGKVYNKRFLTALDSEKEDLMWIRPLKYNHIIIEGYHEKGNYVDRESLYAMVKLNDEGRIDYEASINDDMGKSWIENFHKNIHDLRDSIEKYEEYLQVAKELQEKLKEWGEVNYRFRQSVSFSDKFYLK